MSKVLNFTILASIFLISGFFAMSPANAYVNYHDFSPSQIPINASGGIGITGGSRNDMFFFSDTWFVLQSASSQDVTPYFYISQFDNGLTYILQSASANPIMTPSAPVSCSLGGGASFYWEKCDGFQYINSTHFEFICTREQYATNRIFQIGYLIGKTSDLSVTVYALDQNAGKCSDIWGRLSNRGSGVTGSDGVHITFVNYLGVLRRIRGVTSGSPSYDNYPMPTILALYDFVPLQSSSPTGTDCFHDTGTDCGSQLVYTATTPTDGNRRVYVNEYSYGVCTFNPSNFCYFSGEVNLVHTKKLFSDQTVGSFDVVPTSSGYEMVYEDFSTGEYWWALFDKDWNIVTRYEIQGDFAQGNPYASEYAFDVSAYPCGGSICWSAVTSNSYNLTKYDYVKFRFDCRYSIIGSTSPMCIVKISEITNISNTVTYNYTMGVVIPVGTHDYWNDSILPSSLQGKNLKVEFNITAGGSSLNGFSPYIDFFSIGSVEYPKLSFGIEDERHVIYGGQKGGYDAYIAPYVVREKSICTCNHYSAGGCVGDYRYYSRTCYPPACDVESYYQFEESCAGGCTPQYKCYNSTSTALWKSDCTWDLSTISNCPYYCNLDANACYDSPVCPPCPNGDMEQADFPDCSCSCTNLCTLGYENVSISCACKSMVVDTTNWRSNPVSFFQDIASGMVAMFGGIAIPLTILILAVGIGSIIALIMKKAIK